MATMNVNGIDLFYETRGSGDRIWLTHGAWTDGRGWQEVVDRLVDRYEVTVWDRRGHSRSANGDPPGSCRQDAADLAALIEKTGTKAVRR